MFLQVCRSLAEMLITISRLYTPIHFLLVGNAKQLKLCVGILFRLLNASTEAPALRSDILKHIESISVDNDNDIGNNSGAGER